MFLDPTQLLKECVQNTGAPTNGPVWPQGYSAWPDVGLLPHFCTVSGMQHTAAVSWGSRELRPQSCFQRDEPAARVPGVRCLFCEQKGPCRPRQVAFPSASSQERLLSFTAATVSFLCTQNLRFSWFTNSFGKCPLQRLQVTPH